MKSYKDIMEKFDLLLDDMENADFNNMSVAQLHDIWYYYNHHIMKSINIVKEAHDKKLEDLPPRVQREWKLE
jgi:hypothetical protein